MPEGYTPSGKGVKVIHSIPAPTVRLPHSTPTAETVLEPHKATLHPTAQRIFTQLFETALHVSQVKGHSPQVSQVTLHQPVEIVCVALGISRVTFYSHLASLKAAGIIYSKGHTASWYGLGRKSGTLFAVALRPHIRARLSREDYAHKWRDLEGDTRKEGHTAWSFLKTVQSQSQRQKDAKTALKAWAVNPGTLKNPVTNDCKGSLGETVYSLEMLTDTHYSQRPKLLNSLATALARGFLDSANLNFWRKLLWDALKRESEGLSTLYRLSNALTRLMADVKEWQGLKSPGALLVHRLKECGLWDELKYT